MQGATRASLSNTGVLACKVKPTRAAVKCSAKKRGGMKGHTLLGLGLQSPSQEPSKTLDDNWKGPEVALSKVQIHQDVE